MSRAPAFDSVGVASRRGARLDVSRLFSYSLYAFLLVSSLSPLALSLTRCKKKASLAKLAFKKKGKVRLRYVGNPKPTQGGQEYGRKRDGLEKKPRSTLPVGLRFK